MLNRTGMTKRIYTVFLHVEVSEASPTATDNGDNYVCHQDLSAVEAALTKHIPNQMYASL